MIKHSCTNSIYIEVPSTGGYGPAIDACWEEPDGTFSVSNDEYGSQVNYCPYCGAKAPTQMEINTEQVKS